MASPHIINHLGLHRAALDGDDNAVRQALDKGADINSLDGEGRTPIMCAVAGERWQDIDASDASFMTFQRLNAIRIMLRHPQISLHCLNAPYAGANGVIPLSMAAWMNFPELVELLLEESSGAVAVDGLDAHGATALMYATRDNSAEVVQILLQLSHGARPDIRDCNFRSSIQYAVSHPRMLWLCENVLRHHRWRESQSSNSIKISCTASTDLTTDELLSLAHCALPGLSRNSAANIIEPPPLTAFPLQSLARSNKTLISTLSNPPDTGFLRSILFAPALPTNSPPALYPLSVPILVNRPDERGWSVIHHACSFSVTGSPSKLGGKIPEIEILDMVYLAGADVALFTVEEHYTPLHVLVKTSTSVPGTLPPAIKEQIRNFINHLVRDLDAPLGARDKNDETCLHLAAEYGANKDVLEALLDLDRVFHGGRFSKMKNSRGLVASDLATRQDLKDCFTAMKENLDMSTIRRGSVSSALSDNTIDDTVRGPTKQSSLVATVVDEFGFPTTPIGAELPLQHEGPLDIDAVEKTNALLDYMRLAMPTQHTLTLMESTTNSLVKYFQARIEEARKEVEMMKERREEARLSVKELGVALCSQVQAGLGVDVQKVGLDSKLKRESQDSQMTRVSDDNIVGYGGGISHMDVAIQTSETAVGHWRVGDMGTVKPQSWSDWLGLHPHHHNKKGIESFGEFGVVEDKGSKGKSKEKATGTVKLKNWWKKMVTHEKNEKARSPLSSSRSSSTEKLASPSKLELVHAIQDPKQCPVGRQVRMNTLQLASALASESSLALAVVSDEALSSSMATLALQEEAAKVLSIHYEEDGDWTIAKAVRSMPLVMGTARKDLDRIEACLKNADEYLQNAESNVARVGRVLRRALKKRRAIIDEHSPSRTATPTPQTPYPSGYLTLPHQTKASSGPELPSSPGFLGYSISLSLRPSLASITSIASTSSVLTTASNATATSPTTLFAPAHSSVRMTHDDDETKTMRRLLLRRIEAQLTAVYDEVDRVVNWIAIVQGVIGGVQRRTYL